MERATTDTIPAIGDLTGHPHIPEWWVSQPVPIPFFSGMALRFIITDDRGSSGFSPDVHDAISNFLALGDADRLRASQAVYDNYRQTDGCEELPVHEPERIWEFVTPTEIYVSRRPSKDHDIYVQLACECAWEPEHGLQLVYRRGMKLSRVSDQDGHLTHADAYGIPEDEDPR